MALLASGLAACGGDDDTATTSSSEGAAAALPDGQGSAQKGDSGQAGESAGKKAAGGGSGTGEGGSGTGKDTPTGAVIDPTPLEVSGGGSDQFRVKGGDNSVQSWGEESDESQLQAAAEAVHAYYVARANEEWAKACTYIGSPLLEQLRRFAEQPGQEAPDCAVLLKTLTRHPLPASVRRESTIVDAGSLRIGEGNSFLIYRGAGGTVFAMPLVEEDGTWKLTLISPTALG